MTNQLIKIVGQKKTPKYSELSCVGIAMARDVVRVKIKIGVKVWEETVALLVTESVVKLSEC